MFGQIPDFNDGFEFLRKMWGNAAGMPAGLMPGLSSMTPPMDLEEVDRRIQELKTVESWLQLNTNLLRTTIQGLEVQRATLVALKTFGNALSPEAMQSAMENVARAANAPSASPPRRDTRPEPAQPSAAGHDPDADNNEEDEEEPIPGQPPFEPSSAGEAAGAGATAGASAAPEPAAHANLWWDMVQQQFNQIASTAAAASLASLGNMGGFGVPGGGATEAPVPSGTGPTGQPAAKRAPAKKAAGAKAGAKGANNGNAHGRSGKAGAKSAATAGNEGAGKGRARRAGPDGGKS